MSRHRDWDVACKVYIGNLGNNASKYELEDAFSKYGPLKNVWVARNPPGFGFVEFEDSRDAEDAVRGMDGTRICGVSIIDSCQDFVRPGFDAIKLLRPQFTKIRNKLGRFNKAKKLLFLKRSSLF